MFEYALAAKLVSMAVADGGAGRASAWLTDRAGALAAFAPWWEIAAAQMAEEEADDDEDDDEDSYEAEGEAGGEMDGRAERAAALARTSLDEVSHGAEMTWHTSGSGRDDERLRGGN